MTYFVVVCRVEDMTMGYVLDAHPNERGPYLTELATTDNVVVGEYATVRQAHEALTLAMMRTTGPMQ